MSAPFLGIFTQFAAGLPPSPFSFSTPFPKISMAEAVIDREGHCTPLYGASSGQQDHIGYAKGAQQQRLLEVPPLMTKTMLPAKSGPHPLPLLFIWHGLVAFQ